VGVTLALVLALAVLVGISLGLLGGGGSILTVPILSYIAGMSPKAAIASSLFVVAVTSGAALIPHARAGRVKWRTGLLFGGGGMAGAFLGGRLAAHLSGHLLMMLFALMMAATAIAMLRPARTAAVATNRELPVATVLLEGVVVGVVTGLIGAGGGFLVVPALVLLGGLSMQTAVGTSLLVISLKSFAGLAGHLGHVDVDWPLTLAVTAIAVAGSVVGARLAGRIPPAVLRRAFGVFIIVMAGLVLAKELLA
jgi:uncharacterized membrane protein YfcA